MHHLDFEKIVDKMGSKYEAVIRMSVIARKMADEGVSEETTGGVKLTSAALREFLQQTNLLPKASTESKD